MNNIKIATVYPQTHMLVSTHIHKTYASFNPRVVDDLSIKSSIYDAFIKFSRIASDQDSLFWASKHNFDFFK